MSDSFKLACKPDQREEFEPVSCEPLPMSN